jgi:hypothetical protein
VDQVASVTDWKLFVKSPRTAITRQRAFPWPVVAQGLYRQVKVLKEATAAAKKQPGQAVAIVSYDEKPGIQAIATTAPDLPPEPGLHATFAREFEYKRHGTLSLLAGIDLVSGRLGGTWALIATIGENTLDERKQGARAGVEHKRGTVAILNIGRVNRNAQQKTERIDEDVPLAAGDLLARILAL